MSNKKMLIFTEDGKERTLAIVERYISWLA